MRKPNRDAWVVILAIAGLVIFSLGLVLGAAVQEGIHQLRAAMGR